MIQLAIRSNCTINVSDTVECKSRKLKDTWIIGKFGLVVQNKEGQRVTEFCQENALVIANTLFQQLKRRLYTTSGSIESPHDSAAANLDCPQFQL